ncbi:MAG TPA: hypothetical protein VFQ61_33000 [Polyangiaceae bacterium]|nr:hypothetical protein [Polyangiaceae bacterium]
MLRPIVSVPRPSPEPTAPPAAFVTSAAHDRRPWIDELLRGGRIPLALGLMVAALYGCSSSDSRPTGPFTGGQGGTGGAAMVSLRFVGDGGALQLAPRDFRRVTAAVDPPGAYTVRFFLLPETDDPGAISGVGDAAIDQSEVISDAEGVAIVTLTAPSQPARLRLRASTGSVSADLPVVVEQAGLATLKVTPKYLGRREVTGWTSSVHLQARCESIQTEMGYPDAPLLLRTPPNAKIALEDVPAVSPLAVVVRGGALIDGCATLESAVPRGENAVEVALVDRPLAQPDQPLADNLLAFRLGSDGVALQTTLAATATQLQSAFRGYSSNDVTAVLNAMEQSLDRDAGRLFGEAREAALWDEVLPSALGRSSGRRLSDAIGRWINVGSRVLQDQAIEGLLDSKGLEVQRIAGASASDTHMQRVDTGDLEVDASDTLAMSTTLAWSSSSLADAVARPPALAETGVGTLGEALAQLLSCTTLARTLAELAEPEVQAWLEECDETCTEASCVTAVDSMWTAALSSVDAEAQLQIAATAQLRLDATARVHSFEGTWVGLLSSGSHTTRLRGPFSGTNESRLNP